MKTIYRTNLIHTTDTTDISTKGFHPPIEIASLLTGDCRSACGSRRRTCRDLTRLFQLEDSTEVEREKLKESQIASTKLWQISHPTTGDSRCLSQNHTGSPSTLSTRHRRKNLCQLSRREERHLTLLPDQRAFICSKKPFQTFTENIFRSISCGNRLCLIRCSNCREINVTQTLTRIRRF